MNVCLVKAEKVIASLQHIILNVSLSNALKHPLPRSIIRIRYEKVNVKFSASSRTIVSYKRVLNIRKSRGKKKKRKKKTLSYCN